MEAKGRVMAGDDINNLYCTSNILCFSLGGRVEDMREHNERKDDGL